MIDLPPGEAHLWFVDAAEIADPGLLSAYLALLSPEERDRRDRYRFDRSKREHLLTRALVRATLSRYAPVAPDAWTFAANEHGCPRIAAPEHAWLRFNLSNTEGLIALLCARDVDVGVDVEDRSRGGETVKIADRFFSPIEVAALRALPEEQQRARFFDYWTLKEAYIKARGMGLAIPLDRFSFLLAPGGPITIAFDPRLDDDPAAWQFDQHALLATHQTSSAVRRGPGAPDVRFVVRKTVPLVG